MKTTILLFLLMACMAAVALKPSRSAYYNSNMFKRPYIIGEQYVLDENYPVVYIPLPGGLQARINNTPRGDTLFLEDGLYLIDTPINIWKPITIYNKHRGAILRFTNQTNWQRYYVSRGTSNPGVLNVISDSVTIYGLTVDQNYRHTGNLPNDSEFIASIIMGGYYLKNDTTGVPKFTQHTQIRNCLVYDTWGNGIVGFQAKTSNITIDSNVIVSETLISELDTLSFAPQTHGRQQISIASGDTIDIKDNVILGNNDDAIAIHTNSTQAQIRRNFINSGGARGRILCAGVHGCIIDSNKFVLEDKSSGYNISITIASPTFNIYRNQNIVCTNNYVTTSGDDAQFLEGILLWGPGDTVLVANNFVSGRGGTPALFGINVKPKIWRNTLAPTVDTQIINGTYIDIINNRTSWVRFPVKVRQDFPDDSVTVVLFPNQNILPR